MSFSPNDLGALQAAILRAVLLRSPLAGDSKVLHFPDIESILEEQEPVVHSANLATADALEAPVRVLGDDELSILAKEQDHLPHLRFLPPEEENGRLRLVLEMRFAFSDLDPLSVGAISVVVDRSTDNPDRERLPGGWRLTEAPMARGY